MKQHPFVSAVASLRFENCFNPYIDRCPVHDRVDAPRRRAMLLSAMLLQASQAPVDAIWIGRDLGYRGGRRTGLALTDDIHLQHHAQRWDLPVERPTKGAAIAERTAAVIWNVLSRIQDRIFLWNVFPLHPHEVNDPFSNRMHNSRERESGQALLELLIDILRPQRLVAIGNDAASAASRIAPEGLPMVKVRHPSYGGQTEFLKQVSLLHALQSRTPSLF
ncbi:MAG: uracil-DNA glycosylase [Achromobacter mucicolens]|uniref:uracil-DNA glycosylase n=1 Tax=Achromobacter mucicolens TaxID=1389922 RepID=UPI003D0FE927